MLKLQKVMRDVEMARDLPMPKYEYQIAAHGSYVYSCKDRDHPVRKVDEGEYPRLQNVTLTF